MLGTLSVIPSKLPPSSPCTFQYSNKTKKLSFQTSASKDHPADDASSRRDLLIGLGGLYGTSTGLSLANNNRNALADTAAPAAPAKPSSLDVCIKPKYINFPSSFVNFELPPPSLRPRVRRPAHLLDGESVAKYQKAVELMRNLPADDPRSFTRQANVHCFYCDGAMNTEGGPQGDLQVHNSWLFFPFHRWYIYFHERILGKLIGDDSFAIPFWNWDDRQGMTLPAIFTRPSSSLYDENRNPEHLPPTLIHYEVDPNASASAAPAASDATIKDDNLKSMYRQMYTNGPTAELFMGKPLLDKQNPGGGSLESVPHGSVHVWTGNKGLDMGYLYAAANDPVFYSHHSNVDRLWNVWQTLGGERKNFTDPAFLNFAFFFFDENAQLNRVTVKDCLNSDRLGYKYQNVRNEWLNAKPLCLRKRKGKGKAINLMRTAEPSFPVSLEKEKVAATVKRPSREGRKGDEVEVLVVDGIEFDFTNFTKFDVYVNAADADALKAGRRNVRGLF